MSLRWLPRSLYGRLVMVLLGGLLLAQLATFLINSSERDQLLFRAGGMRLAQRIADIVKLLDSLPDAERQKVAALFNIPPLQVSLDSPPLAPEEEGQEPDFRQTMFRTALQRVLGDEARISVKRTVDAVLTREMPDRPWGWGAGERRHHGGPGMFAPPSGGSSFLVQVRLQDGALVTFDTTLSPQATPPPLRLAATLLVLLGSVILLALLAVHWSVKPLSTLARAADRLGQNIDCPPMPETGPTEVRRAAVAFNTMQRRLARFISERTGLLTAMSHDLKTPITRLRLRTEMLDDESIRRKFVQDLDEMESMVTETLEFMREGSTSEALQPVNLMTLIESIQADCRETGMTVEISGQIRRAYSLRPQAMRRCLTNLVDNAVRYGQRAQIDVEEQVSGLLLHIRDAGPGIPESELEKIFEPFYRGETSRNRETGGTGLGLGIARNIARAHGGDITLRNLPGGGLEANLRLPNRG
ncbi:MAG: HAMP domain-containing protein [Betaproteobacteria bacterium]|nr:HAMP domain-containing protein [Betaproteobacteria bacterium]